MVTSAVLGAAVGTGLALFVALTLILYHYYYVARRKNKDWGDLERFEGPKKYSSSGSLAAKPSKASVQASEGGFGKCPYGTARHYSGSGSSSSRSPSFSKSSIGSYKSEASGKIIRWDSRGSRTSTKSCPPLFTYPHQEFNVDQEQRIVQPLEASFTFASLPEVRENSLSELASFYQETDCFAEEEMLTHQSRSLPPTVNAITGQRMGRAPSVSSQGSGSQIDYVARKGHRGSSPAIRTFTPEGLVATGDSPPSSPPLIYQGSRSPSPITNIRATSLELNGRGLKNGSPNSSTTDLRISPLGDRNASYSQNSLNSLNDKPLNLQSSLQLSRRSSRCLSPLLIPPKSPSASDSSGQSAPLSPLFGTLQLDLYQKKDVKLLLPATRQPEAAADGLDGVPFLGQLHFQLKYDFDKSDLHVLIIGAHNLSVSNQGGFNDPYIRLFISPEVDTRKRQTKIHRNESNPCFNEQFKFPVSHDDLKEKNLILQVFDFDRYSRNDVVGQVSFRLDEFDVTTNLEIWADVIKNRKPSGERQEILVSLSYLPSAERLTVVLLKARNLFSPPNKDSLDPFVKVYLSGGGKRLKKKKTSARKNTKNPVWNEALTFSISSSSLANAALEICVLDQSNDLMGSSAVVGKVVLGAREDGSELSHWQNMSGNFRKSIAMWHVLT